MGTVMVAHGQPNCNTALGNIANVIAKKAISDDKDKACSGLKKGLIGIDRTEKLVLSKLKLCEDVHVVSAEITVKIKCSTSSAALISASIEESITATASANLDSCSVKDVDVYAVGILADAGIKIADLKTKLQEAAEKEIKPYCK